MTAATGLLAWEEPSYAPQSERVRLPLAELRDRPDTWALVARRDTASAANGVRYRIKSRTDKRGRFEVRVRCIDGTYNVYARFTPWVVLDGGPCWPLDPRLVVA